MIAKLYSLRHFVKRGDWLMLALLVLYSPLALVCAFAFRRSMRDEYWSLFWGAIERRAEDWAAHVAREVKRIRAMVAKLEGGGDGN